MYMIRNIKYINSQVQRGFFRVLSAVGFMALVGGCGTAEVEPRVKDTETEPTQISINLISQEIKDGIRTYVMTTSRMERYELAEEPYVKFPEGIDVKTFNDSTKVLESELVADYAHYNETKKLWEATGNVVATNYAGHRTLYTEQLWWNEITKRIYSDTVSKIVEQASVHIGLGFEADEKFEEWIFRKPQGQMEMVVKKDSTAVND